MSKYIMEIKTPRGTIRVHTIFSNMDVAKREGWGLAFQHENYLILGRNNRIGAIVELGAEPFWPPA